ncbi:cytochrome P450 [Streptomyces sp. DG2A-72]|uniref:cytochrome P450 family protein n=1 Tax=Streptomyces sp. DG2A-72 TaxID=3051386 RepID=UPI00265BD708|nr:cytochrome P450 [Streptomyces sp. DG2A-72]MDO0939329.1 cytochrome P450 [Streptomyces sp. DG2A-72]
MTAPILSPPPLFTGEYFQNPYPAFTWLRENSPVHPLTFPVGNLPMWLVTRYEDVRAILGDHNRFSSDAPRWATEDFKKAGMAFGTGTVIEQILSVLDPPDHTRVRKLAMGAFTPRRTATWKEPTEQIVQSALDRMQRMEQPDVMEFASIVPAEVIGRVLGIPLDRFKEILHAIERALHVDPEHTDESTKAYQEIVDYGREVITEKRRNPGDDLTTTFIDARDGDDRLDEDELVALVALMIMVGLDTTRNLIGSGVLALLDHPDQRDLLRAEPQLADTAVEEFLRYDGALTVALIRFTKEDVEVAGTRIPAGSTVIAALQSANRDPAYFAHPDRLDITRNGDARHLGLGHGLHNCLGAALARLETRIAVPAVFERFPDLSLAVPRSDLRYGESWLLRSLESLPVHLNSKE